jgi:peptide/nickel transport system permease protein
MRQALLRRSVVAAGTILAVLTVTFVALHLMPGDPVRLYLGPDADPAAVLALRHDLGLDRPLLAQYLDWLRRFVVLDWGTSLAQRRAVTSVLADALGPTLLLTGLSLVLSWVTGLFLGTLQAARRGSRTDGALTAITIAVQAIPAYVLGLGLVLIFAYGAALWGWLAVLRLPAMGAAGAAADFLAPGARFADRLRHLVLPTATLALIGAAGIARYVRTMTVDALRHPAVRMARAKGLGEWRVLLAHAVRSAAPPLITLAALQLPALFSGAVFVETIFAWPGMGRVAVSAVLARDYPVVLAVTAVFAVLVVTANLLADGLAVLADPRTRERA